MGKPILHFTATDDDFDANGNLFFSLENVPGSSQADYYFEVGGYSLQPAAQTPDQNRLILMSCVHLAYIKFISKLSY